MANQQENIIKFISSKLGGSSGRGAVVYINDALWRLADEKAHQIAKCIVTQHNAEGVLNGVSLELVAIEAARRSFLDDAMPRAITPETVRNTLR
jgi:hypothetical protein